MLVFQINVLPVMLAGVAAFVVGFLWHGPLFGKTWLDLMGVSPQEVEAMRVKGFGAMAPQMAAGLAQQMVVAAVVSIFLHSVGASSPASALPVVGLAWLGFVVSVLFTQFLWEKRSSALFGFGATYHLVNLAVMAVVISWWK